jgi:hypothetical protein
MLKIYESCKAVPEEAKKTITAGRLKGYTDINPMWRIKKLTEMFGACGIGWYYVPLRTWKEELANGEVCVFADIELYIKQDGEWSKPIFGTGGSKLVSLEKKGAYVNDEAYKMANTDAISVACKQLGMGADVYWSADNTKYNDSKKPDEIENMMADAENTRISKNHADILRAKASKYGVDVAQKYGKVSIEDLTEAEYGRAMNKLAEMGERNG